MHFAFDEFGDIRDGVRAVCADFPDEYHRKVDHDRAYPEAFVDALTKAGWMAALIPEEYGGSGLSLTAASVIMEEINRAGGNSGACHGQMYNMNTLIRHGSEEQRQTYLPKIAAGELRLQSMGVTEPTTGTDTTKIKTTAVRKGDRYVINGQKVWISRVKYSDLMILLARTTPLEQVEKKSQGLSIFLVDIHDAVKSGMSVRPIDNMVNHQTNELFFDNLEIPAENLIGEEGMGFKYIMTGLNAERALIAAECIGDGYWFIDRVSAYASDRQVFGRPIGQNQGVQFPIAEAFIEAGADIINVSTGQTSHAAQPQPGRMFQTPLSDIIRNDGRIPTIAVGNIYETDHVNSIIAAGRADLVCLARPHLADPNWTLHAAAELGYQGPGAAEQHQYFLGYRQAHTLAEREREAAS